MTSNQPPIDAAMPSVNTSLVANVSAPHDSSTLDPQSTPRISEIGGTPALDDEFQFPPEISGIPPGIVPFYDVKMDGPDCRIREGYEKFLEYQANPTYMLAKGESTREDLEKAARENVGYAFNEGYLKPLSNPATPPAVKKQITDALLERAHGKVGTDVNVKLSGAVGVVTIGSEDIARLIEFANQRAAAGDEAVVISE